MHRPLLSAVLAVAMSIGLAAPSAYATSDPAASEVGAFVTDGDHVHVSSTPPPTASGHGWWLDPTGKHKNVKAKVTVWLQVKDGGGWRTVAEGSKKVKAGGKGASSRRANARRMCENRDRTRWRSVIDVDLIGIPDSPEKAVTKTVTLLCGV